MKKEIAHLLEPKVVSKLGGLEIIARLVVEGFVAGLHRSPYHGFSVEFTEHRQYEPGDELRHVDWKVYGKTDRFYIKQFEEETNLKAYILLDASNSMSFHSNGISKLQYSKMLASAMTYLMLRQQDAVGLVTFDEKIRSYIPPRAVLTHLNVVLRALTEIKPAKKTGALETFKELANRIKRRGLIIVLSDLLTEPEEVLHGLKYFRHQKHEVIVFQVLDPAELSLNYNQEFVFKDLETGEELQTRGWEIKNQYDRKVQDMIANFRRKCRESLIDYQFVNTATPFDEALTTYLRKRARLG